ncbi:cation-transporting P-type ATPase [Bythopirellula goksoeyrii]|uniref:Putative cation-transporting ATPase F n=1 Tax=Bythopirellula goksoeyrii TaxID=1400387 RepID=A0A5B9QQB7_9BACT|nr:cation-transporting P-type ATPase [Bythopirellula goksoeyrii]QEG36321.1 putative cation-transporting ATPase F [Bythopirellula goksoeyrii]
MEIPLETHLHQLPADEVVKLLDSDSKTGLELFEIQARQERFGPNAIPVRRGRGPLLTFLLQFHQPLIYILVAAGGITAALHEWIDAGVIFAVVLVNAIIGFLQESKAAKALEALAKMTVTEASVLRSGEVHKIPSVELVPGDIVVLQSGDKIPADLRLFRCRDLQVDESTLTGESVPVQKNPEPLPAVTPLAERCNLVYSSTLVTFGQGRGVVFATGGKTEVGRISEMVSTADIMQTPLTRKIARFSHLLLIVILVLAGITFGVGVLRGESAFDMFMAAVAFAVGAIPEGLPAAVTITLAIGVGRMARRRAIIRKLPAVETLGSTTTICSDKTGTLTVNQMTVREIYSAGRRYQVTGSGYDPDGHIKANADAGDAADNASVKECLQAGLLCNDSTLVQKEGRWSVNGDPTEGALLVSALKTGLDERQVAQQWPRLDSIPFESQHQYMATLHNRGAGSSRLVYVKGAVEVILSKCKSALDPRGHTVALDAAAIHADLEEMASEGLRVLAFAKGEMPAEATAIGHSDIANLTFLGLQGMIDPPRPEAIQAVRACHNAGIRVKMITGDHPVTARSIAKKLGLDGAASDAARSPLVMTSHDLAEKSDQELIDIADRVAVFARATPEQKLRIVRALQANGHVVAMTGDGVNDAPALKQADIGVAMGVGGTEVAKESADMILTDDNFATIEAAVEEGRGVFDNLTKFIVWTLPTNLGEGLVILAAVFAGVTLPLLPVQILWINMTTAVLLGLMLAFEPKELDIMRRPPRDPKTPILDGMLIVRICIVGLILLIGAFGSFEWALGQGFSDAAARTVAVNVFVMVELFYLFNCRSLTKSMFALGLFSNRWIAIGVTSMVALQLAFTYVPFMNHMFHSAPIGWDAWWRILLTGVAAYVIIGTEKWFRRLWTPHRNVRLADNP